MQAQNLYFHHLQAPQQALWPGPVRAQLFEDVGLEYNAPFLETSTYDVSCDIGLSSFILNVGILNCGLHITFAKDFLETTFVLTSVKQQVMKTKDRNYNHDLGLFLLYGAIWCVENPPQYPFLIFHIKSYHLRKGCCPHTSTSLRSYAFYRDPACRSAFIRHFPQNLTRKHGNILRSGPDRFLAVPQRLVHLPLRWKRKQAAVKREDTHAWR